MNEAWDLNAEDDEIALRPVVEEELVNFDSGRAQEDPAYLAQASAAQGFNFDEMPDSTEEKVKIVEEAFDSSLYPPNADDAFSVTRKQGNQYEVVEVQANGVFTYEAGVADSLRLRDGPNEVQGERITGQWNSELTKDIWEDIRMAWGSSEGVNPHSVPDSEKKVARDKPKMNESVDYDTWSVGDEVGEYNLIDGSAALVQHSPVSEEDPDPEYSSRIKEGLYSPETNPLVLQAVVGMARGSLETLTSQEDQDSTQVDIAKSMVYDDN